MSFKKSKNYAGSLLETHDSPEFLKQLQTLSELFEEPQIQAFFKAQNIPSSEKKALLKKSLKALPQSLQNFLFLLLDYKSFALLPEITQLYQEAFDEKHKIQRALVSSPQKLSEEQKKNLIQILSKIFNKKIELKEKQDKSLITGLSVQAGEYLLSGNGFQQLQSFEKLGGS